MWKLILSIFLIPSLLSCNNKDKNITSEINKNIITQNYTSAPVPFLPDYNPKLWDDKIKPIELTQEQLIELEKTKNLPPIIALRNALKDYVSGKRVSEYFYKSALGDSLTIKERIGLDAFDANYYANKFIALVFNNLEDNVIEVFILPAKNPDKIFVAHLHNETNNDNPKFVLKLFMQSHHTNTEINTIRNQLKELLKDEKYLF